MTTPRSLRSRPPRGTQSAWGGPALDQASGIDDTLHDRPQGLPTKTMRLERAGVPLVLTDLPA